MDFTNRTSFIEDRWLGEEYSTGVIPLVALFSPLADCYRQRDLARVFREADWTSDGVRT